MMIECKKRNLFIKNQQEVNVFYENSLIGSHFVDLLVNNKIVVELKAVQSIHKNHHAWSQFFELLCGFFSFAEKYYGQRLLRYASYSIITLSQSN